MESESLKCPSSVLFSNPKLAASVFINTAVGPNSFALQRRPVVSLQEAIAA
jgi:hypothetical protein